MADGSVVIDSKMDLKGFNEGTKQASSKMLKFEITIRQTEESISSMKNEMAELADTEVPTTEYEALTKKIAAAEQQFDLMARKIEILGDEGKPYGTLPEQTERLRLKIEALKKTQEELPNKFVKGSETEHYRQLAENLNKATDKLPVLKRQLEEEAEKHNKVANEIKKVDTESKKTFASIISGNERSEKGTKDATEGLQAYNKEMDETTAKQSKVANGIRSIGNASKKSFATIISGGKKSGKSLKDAAEGVQRLSKRLMNVLASVFVFTVLNKAFTALRTYMGSALATNEEFSASLAQIKSNLATAFYPIYQAALPAINALMSALARITGTIATFIAMLFGTTVSKAQAGAKSLQAQAAGISGVGKAAGKVQKQLAGFDDAQILSKPDEDSSSGGGCSGGTAQTGEVKTDSKLLAWLDELKNKLEPFISAIQRLRKAFMPFAGNVFKGFIDFFASLLGSDIAVGIINLLAAALERISPETAQNIGKALGILATSILLYKVGSSVYNSLMGLVDLLKILASTTVGKILISVAVAYIGFSAGNKIYEWLTGEKIDMSIGEQLSEILGTLFGDFGIFCDAVGNMFWDFGQSILGLFGLDGMTWQEFKEAVKMMWSDFVSVLGKIPQFFVNIGKGIKEAITSIPQFFSNIFKKAWGYIQNIFKPDAVTNFFKGVVNRIKNLFQKIGSTLGNAVGRTFASGVNVIFGTIESIVNGFVNMINGAIKLINKIPGVKISRLSTISLPRLASGTVVPANYGEFLAVLGDNKRETEVVSPLSTMKQAVKEAINETGGGGNGDIKIDLTVNLDGQKVYQTVVKYNNRNTKLTGENALAY